MTSPVLRVSTALTAALVVALVLSACGKRSAPRPPEGLESEYRYPQVYPAPHTVLPDESEEPEPSSPPAESPEGSSSP